jgi:alpha-N-arabinofuranosidase
MEYCLIPGGTARADERARHGRAEPFPIRMWCLGNEMDGPWQLGHRTAEEYGSLAMQTAKAMKQLDPDAQLVVCGSSSHDMPTFGTWERTVLERTYDDVDFISCHAYYEPRGDRASFLASGVDMAGFIAEVVEIADAVGRERGSDKRIGISFDEWNVWYLSEFNDHGKITGLDNWPVAPRLIEDSYSVDDAVVVGALLITLLQHAERVTSASLAQLVNVIAPIMTEPDGPAWRQTTFYPFAITSRWGRGESIGLTLDVATTPTARYGDVAAVDAVATRDGDRGAVFLVNRSLTDAAEVSVDVGALGWSSVTEALALTDDDPNAANTLDDPERVAPVSLGAAVDGGILAVTLPPASWAAVDLR